jgi:hypothetical protein
VIVGEHCVKPFSHVTPLWLIEATAFKYLLNIRVHGSVFTKISYDATLKDGSDLPPEHMTINHNKVEAQQDG